MRALQCGSLSALLACFVIAGCSGSAPPVPNGGASQLPLGTSAAPKVRPTRCPTADYTCIQHVVIIIQENRSFNNLFMGFPGAATRTFGMAGSAVIPLQPRTFESQVGDISHCYEDAINAWDRGKMDHFDEEEPRVSQSRTVRASRITAILSEPPDCITRTSSFRTMHRITSMKPAPIGRWPDNTSSPIITFQPISAPASPRISTWSPARQTSRETWPSSIIPAFSTATAAWT